MSPHPTLDLASSQNIRLTLHTLACNVQRALSCIQTWAHTNWMRGYSNLESINLTPKQPRIFAYKYVIDVMFHRANVLVVHSCARAYKIFQYIIVFQNM